jgi:hypothetical protein
MKVRVGSSEFEAEGDEITVNDQYRLFLEAIRHIPTNGHSAQNGKESRHQPKVAAELEGMWARFYSIEPGNNVSLKTLPNSDQQNADALVLLLYGYEQLCERDTVGSAEFLAMAKKSGLRIDRIDRTIPSGYSRFINRGGSRRGCRYSLNNQGKAHAQQLLEAEAER